MIPLFKYHPLLEDKLPYVALSVYPTPVQKLERLGSGIGVDYLYIKRDDLTGKVYGGNKIRKLEFVLGQALRSGAKEVLTFGLAGAQDALATVVSAQQVGLRSISVVMPQPNALYVRRNLLLMYYCGAELHQHRNMPFLVFGAIYQLLRHKLKFGSFPRFIPGRRPTPLGTVGFVNAAFELREQIRSGEIPEPDLIYVALASGGTAVGLKLGLKAASLISRVIAVQAAGEKLMNVKRLAKLYDNTASLLHSLDPSFPKLRCSNEDMRIRHISLEQEHAFSAEKVTKAVSLMEKGEGIQLDRTYTGRAFACLMDDAEKGDLRDRVVLFWNTYNSRYFSDAIATVDYRRLPRCFHRYFEEEAKLVERPL